MRKGRGGQRDRARTTSIGHRRCFTKVHGTYRPGLGAADARIRRSGSANAAGFSPQRRGEPFANFYFGGFGNNYVDHQDEKRYREYYALPGVELNEIGGRNFVEVGRRMESAAGATSARAGTPGFYLTWMRPAIFAGGLVTNLDAAGIRRTVSDVGGQLDFRLNMLSTLDLTLSVGGAVAYERGRRSASRSDGLAEDSPVRRMARQRRRRLRAGRCCFSACSS